MSNLKLLFLPILFALLISCGNENPTNDADTVDKVETNEPGNEADAMVGTTPSEMVGTWSNEEKGITYILNSDGTAKETITEENSSPKVANRSWSVKEDQLCFLTAGVEVENCYPYLLINEEEIELSIFDEKVILKKQS